MLRVVLRVSVFQRVACCYGRSGLHASVVRVGRQRSVLCRRVLRVGVGGSVRGDACCVSVAAVRVVAVRVAGQGVLRVGACCVSAACPTLEMRGHISQRCSVPCHALPFRIEY